MSSTSFPASVDHEGSGVMEHRSAIMSDNTDFELIPTRFWKTVTTSELMQVIDNGGALTAELIERLWRMQDRQGLLPDQATIPPE